MPIAISQLGLMMSRLRTATLLVCLWVLTIIAASGCHPGFAQSDRIERIEAYSASLSLQTAIAWWPWTVIRENPKSRKEIRDSSLFSHIDRVVNQLSVGGEIEQGRINARVVCLLFRLSKRVDTLSFNHMDMGYNDKRYRQDTALFAAIVKHLDVSLQEEYEYIQNDRRQDAGK